MDEPYPVSFSVDYPDRPLDRLSTAFRIFTVIPIAIVLAAIGGYSSSYGGGAQTTTIAIGGTGLLFLPPLLMILFRQKYPRWWFDWNLELLRFNLDYPDAREGLNRWLPLVKWLLAIPHYVVLFFLWIGAVLAAIAARFAILVTDRYPPFRLRP